MSLKLVNDGGRDIPVIICDVCGKRIVDVWDDLVSGTRGTFESPGTLVFHHKTCSTTEPVHTSLRAFLAMLGGRNRFGELGQNGGVDRVVFEMHTDEDFE